nr:hypothetical protein [Tanacetum cinerariifolium]
MQTNQFARAVSAILGIIQRYMDQLMNKAVKVAIQIQSDRLHDKAQEDNDEFLKTIDENMQKIIKEQVKEQVKTSYVVATDLSEMELKEILIEKMKGNKSIHRSNDQRNLYKALVEAYESDKIILDTYEDTVTLKRRRDDDADKDEEPSARSDRGSKRRREGKEPESASAPKEKVTRSTGKSTQRFKSRQTSASESATTKEPMQTTFKMEEPSHPEFDTGADDQPIIKHKDTKKSNEMYYPRFMKVIIYHFMSKEPSIPRRNKVNWHYVRDDHMFSMIKLVSRHHNTQQFSALLPIELTNKGIRNSNAYKEYYAVATGVTPPKPKASGKQAAKASKAKSLSALSEEEISWNSTDKEGDDDEGKDGDGDDDDGKEEDGNDDDEDDDGEEGNGEENLGINVGREEGHDEEEEKDEL